MFNDKKKKVVRKSKFNKTGGAVYGFDLNDNIGGLPARVALTNTNDSDCPSSANYDLGFSNYGIASAKGGYYNTKGASRTSSTSRTRKNQKSRKSRKSHNTNNKFKSKLSRNKLSGCACDGVM